jgi:hypothetical protein
MSESPAGARLNFAMRGDVRASPIEFSWGSQTVTSVTGALPRSILQVNTDKCVSGPGARCPVYKNDVPFSDGAVIGSMLRPY